MEFHRFLCVLTQKTTKMELFNRIPLVFECFHSENRRKWNYYILEFHCFFVCFDTKNIENEVILWNSIGFCVFRHKKQ